MRRASKIWIGIGACAITLPHAMPEAVAHPLPSFQKPVTVESTLPGVTAPERESSWLWLTAGEGGEGGEGGEAGIDTFADAATNPVTYGVALGIIEAHIRAGLAAYDAGEKSTGAEMFAHGYSEVFAPLESVFAAKGASNLGISITALVTKANEKPSRQEISPLAAAALSSLDTIRKTGVADDKKLGTRVQILLDLLDRAAAQYSVVLKDAGLEPYLDGLGFTLAAENEASAVIASLGANSDSAKAIKVAIDVAKQAYPGAVRPTKPIDRAVLLVAVANAKLAASKVS